MYYFKYSSINGKRVSLGLILIVLNQFIAAGSFVLWECEAACCIYSGCFIYLRYSTMKWHLFEFIDKTVNYKLAMYF